MNKITVAAVLAGSLLLGGCASHIKISKEQAATMSNEAVATLKRLKVKRVPFIKVSDKNIIKIREQFAEIERGQLEEMKAKFNPEIRDTIIAGVHTYIITPQHIKPENKDKIIIYIHGGGFVMGSATDRTGMLMANELGIKTYAIDYSLAPEAPFPVAMEECLSVYKHLIENYNPTNIVGVSTSAGSAHMVAMLLKAKEQHLPMISAISLLSPSVDLSGEGDAIVANEGRDILSYKNQQKKYFYRPFLGSENPKNPYVSPVYATYSKDFPATSIVTGTRDLLLSGSVRLYWKLKNAGVRTELVVSEGMWHAYTNFPDIPEAVEARRVSQEFLIHSLEKNNE